MEAHTGDRLLTHGRTVGQHDRVAEIIEVLGDGGSPPYRSALRGRARDRSGPRAPTASSSTPPPEGREPVHERRERARRGTSGPRPSRPDPYGAGGRGSGQCGVRARVR